MRTVSDGYLKKHNIMTYPLSWEAYHNDVWTHANTPENVDLVLTKLVLNGENVDTEKLPTLCLSVLNKGSYVYIILPVELYSSAKDSFVDARFTVHPNPFLIVYNKSPTNQGTPSTRTPKTQ